MFLSLLPTDFHSFISSSTSFPCSSTIWSSHSVISGAGNKCNPSTIVFPPHRPNPLSSSSSCRACLVTDPSSFQVGRLIGSYGFINITRFFFFCFFLLITALRILCFLSSIPPWLPFLHQLFGFKPTVHIGYGLLLLVRSSGYWGAVEDTRRGRGQRQDQVFSKKRLDFIRAAAPVTAVVLLPFVIEIYHVQAAVCRLYEGMVIQGPLRGTSVVFKVR